MLEMAVEAQALSKVTAGAEDVVLVQGQDSGSVQHPGAGQRRSFRTWKRHQRGDASSSPSQIAAYLPYMPQHASQVERLVCIGLTDQPGAR